VARDLRTRKATPLAGGLAGGLYWMIPVVWLGFGPHIEQ